MNLHVRFSNGSEPMIRYRLSKKKYQMIIGELLNNFELVKEGSRAGIDYWLATPKAIVTTKEADI